MVVGVHSSREHIAKLGKINRVITCLSIDNVPTDNIRMNVVCTLDDRRTRSSELRHTLTGVCMAFFGRSLSRWA